MKLTKEALRGLQPCWTDRQIDDLYERSEKICGDKNSFDVEDMLYSKIVSKLEILWIVLRPEYVDFPTLRSFAADCAEAALRRDETAGNKVHPSSWEAVRVARKLARGEATEEERAAARKAAVITSDSAKAASWTVAEAYPEVVKAVHWSAIGTSPNSAVRGEQVELLWLRLAACMPIRSRGHQMRVPGQADLRCRSKPIGEHSLREYQSFLAMALPARNADRSTSSGISGRHGKLAW